MEIPLHEDATADRSTEIIKSSGNLNKGILDCSSRYTQMPSGTELLCEQTPTLIKEVRYLGQKDCRGLDRPVPLL